MVEVKIKYTIKELFTRAKLNESIARALREFRADLVIDAKAIINRLGRVDTGRMRDTINTELLETSSGDFQLTFNAPALDPRTGVHYASFQEFGTARITPANFMMGSVKKNLQAFVDRVDKIIEAEA